MKNKITIAFIFYWTSCLTILFGQNAIPINEAFELAQANNLGIDIFRKSIVHESALVDGQVPVDKTNFYYEYDRNNIAENGNAIHVLGIGQNFKLPSTYKHYKNAQQSNVIVQERILMLEQQRLAMKIENVYEDYAYYLQKQTYLLELDSIYSDYLAKANRNLELGGGTMMESLTAKQKVESLRLDLNAVKNGLISIETELRNLIQADDIYIPQTFGHILRQKELVDLDSSLLLGVGQSQVESKMLQSEARYSDRLPEFNISLFGGLNSFNDIVLYPGVQLGFSMALSQGYHKARKKADQVQTEIFKIKLEDIRMSLQFKKEKLEEKLRNLEESISMYNTLRTTADQLITTANKALSGGEINYFQYLTTLDEAHRTKIRSIELIHDYNRLIIEYNYLLND